MNANRPGNADDLRRRVEALLASASQSADREAFKGVGELANELAAHQAELELQNEELRCTQALLQETRDRYAMLFEDAPVGYVVLDAAGIIRQANATWSAMTGRPPQDVRGRPFADSIVKADAGVFRARFRAFFRNPAEKQIDVRITRSGGGNFHARIEAKPRHTSPRCDDAAMSELMVIVSDISDVKHAHREIDERNAELARINTRLDHVYRVLLAIRNVNQLITQTTDRDELLAQACTCLTETHGYHHAWIALLDDERRLIAAYESGLGEAFTPMIGRLRAGNPTSRCALALSSEEVVVTPCPAETCTDCYLAPSYRDRGAMTAHLSHDGRSYGVLNVSIPRTLVHDEEEHALMAEVAGDIAFALHAIEVNTERDRLQASLERAKLILESSASMLFRWSNAEGWPVEYVSANIARLGYTPEDLTAGHIPYASIVHPDDLERVAAEVAAHTASGGEEFAQEYRLRDAAGNYRWVADRTSVDRDATGAIVAFQGVLVDITERKLSEEQLAESQQRLALATAAAAIGIWDWDIVNDRMTWDDQMFRLYGIAHPPEAYGVELWENGLHPDDKARAWQACRAALRGDQDFDTEFRVRWPDGTVRHLKADGVVLRDAQGEPLRMIGTNFDITERKQADEILRESEQRLQAVFNAVDGVPIQGYDTAHRVIFWNPASEDLYGYAREEALGRRLEELIVPPEAREAVAEAICRWHDEGLPVPASELELVHKDGTRLRVYSNHVMITNGRGEKEMFCIDVDLTDIRRVEKKMASFAAVVENSDNIVVVRDMALRVLATNHAFAQAAGHDTVETMIGKTDAEILGIAPDVEPVRSYMADDRRAQALPRGQYILREEPFITPDGDRRVMLTKKYPIRDPSGETIGTGSISTDITERTRLEERMRRMEKMDAIGHLAGGVAHDFNNQLSGILGYTQMLKQRVSGRRESQCLDRILMCVERSSDLTQQLLSFSRQNQQRPEPTDAHAMIGETVALLGRSVDKRIEIVQTLEAADHIVCAEPSRLQNAILNLGLNARDAMADGGELCFATANVDLDPANCTGERSTLVPGRYLRLQVSDTGCGMSPAVQRRIFEPFYTTKEVGKGTGMGLATVYGTVSQCGGTVGVTSQQGTGTTFDIMLPLAEHPAGSPVTRSIDPKSLAGTTVLLVDDEEHLRELGAFALQDVGCRVHLAADGQTAVDLYRDYGDEIDVVILDMIMPRLGGRETLVALREIDPAVPVLVVSGYSDGVGAEKLIDLGADAFLQKPYHEGDLFAKLLAVLHRSSA